MNKTYEFCKNAERIYTTTGRTADMLGGNFNIDLESEEVYRDRHDINSNCIFNMELGLKNGCTVKEEVDYMQTIELFYPNVFSWRFNGHHIECIGRIPVNNDTVVTLGRYRGEYGFIQMVRDRFLEILKYRGDLLILAKVINPYIISTGSINMFKNMWVVDISPKDTFAQILNNSNNRRINSVKIKTLDMNYWIKELNPDFFREYEPFRNVSKYPVSISVMSKYPPCIQKLMLLKTKGNYPRFLLSTFLLGVHNERDAKHQLDMMLSDTERQHMNIGNCKDQWRAIVARRYSSPSCKTMIENGYCPFKCSRFGMPTNLEIEAKDESQKIEKVKI